MKVIVAGSRTFSDYEMLKRKLDLLLALQPRNEIVIVSGAAKGADKLGERYATEKGYRISSHPADWEKCGNNAEYIRNEEMAKKSNALVAFWDGTSKGTKHMIDLAHKYELQVRVVRH
ncbi:DUF2493 domain-containing protein [Paenibacillus chitinolyticus]|uniref:DUF2493 domain-containing protein n=1 Tax=Paenibacillus chitinolyticus TaxID=79263 RepID=A0A410WX79_9BACL|nr:DUF2493 domain-containing protein [Paenibacillus chitinolyticus]MCY9592374.1 DUF2493 domain-containing protein [Paenibacillus chitinolyticus]MCY9599835.1 DUF2493 domain-containing protein [Paenibacillus chitinolyticus]QAV18892.1 DUF2493 domain-containing protein [Paenibacillus chitinolyticus]